MDSDGDSPDYVNKQWFTIYFPVALCCHSSIICTSGKISSTRSSGNNSSVNTISIGTSTCVTISFHYHTRVPHKIILPRHSGWTQFHPMYENSTLCTKWFVHQANTAGAFIVHQANATEALIVHQGNGVEHFGRTLSRTEFTHNAREIRSLFEQNLF